MALSIYQFKPAFQRLLLPLVRRLAVAGVSPNQITLLALLLSVGLGAALWHWPEQQWLWWAFPCWMLLRMALNAADGLLATYSQQQTPLGALLNEMADVLADVALYLPFLLLPGASAALVIAFVICALLSEFAGLLALRIGAPAVLTALWEKVSAQCCSGCWRSAQHQEGRVSKRLACS